MTAMAATVALMCLMAALVFGEGGPAPRWEPVGPGGGGGVFHPSISPQDADLAFVSCDMGGFYRTEDGYRNWRMLDGRSVRNISHAPVFRPGDDKVIFVGARGGLKRSTDRGLTWEHVLGMDKPERPDQVGATAFDPDQPDTLWAAFTVFRGQGGSFLFRSDDCGDTWDRVEGWAEDRGGIMGLYVDPTSPRDRRRLFAATRGGVWRSDDGGRRWALKEAGAEGLSVTAFGAGTAPGREAPLLYLVAHSGTAVGRFVGGVYRSEDLGETWQQVVTGLNTGVGRDRRGRRMVPQYGPLSVCATDALVAYLGCRDSGRSRDTQSTVYRTADGGEHWKPVLFGDRRFPPTNVADDWLTLETNWGWGGVAIHLGCRPTDPNDCIRTDSGRAFRTTDGGQSWFPVYSRRAGERLWQGIGLEVTTCYEYYFDPHDPQRTYITYTDIGMFLSPDRGRSWQYGAKGSPWSSNCYEIAFDPDEPGLLWGAWGTAHDLPHWKMLRRGGAPGRGGVCRSTDGGSTWTPRRPGPDGPVGTCTRVVLDPTSPRGRRTLYVADLGHGVYKSTDSGRTWAKKSWGINLGENPDVWQLALADDGTLYCAVTIAYKDGKPIPGALYRSRDGAEHWELVNTSQPFPWIWGVQTEPGNPDVLYVSCFDVPPAGFAAMGTRSPWPVTEGGGLFKSTDAGKTWVLILDVHQVWDVSFDPRDPKVLYACTLGRGVFRSDDAGATWKHLDGPPFLHTHKVTPDPKDPDTIYVTTFGGGVWRTRLKDVAAKSHQRGGN